MRLYRAWINQPSQLQPLHDRHGQRCIVEDHGGPSVVLHFTEGDVHSMIASRLCVSQIYLCSAHRGAVESGRG